MLLNYRIQFCIENLKMKRFKLQISRTICVNLRKTLRNAKPYNLCCILQMGHDELFQRISVDLGLNNAFIGLKMSSKLNDLPEHFTPRPELQVIFYEIESFFHQ